MDFTASILADSSLSPEDQIVLILENRILVSSEKSFRLPLRAEVEPLLSTVTEIVPLGLFQGANVHACESVREVEVEGFIWREFRSLIAELTLSEFHLLSHAKHLLHWRSKQQYCGACGSGLVDSTTERARVCPACHATFYPVIAPAVIVAIMREGKILLAHGRNRPNNMRSVIAGFVDAGETLEQAVAREAWEEVGLRVTNIHYVESQAWPFPNSLMLGFTAECSQGEIKVDGVEIDAADWYSRDNLPEIPGPGSISHRLIELL